MHHPESSFPSSRSRRCRRGATLVELLVALLLFDIALLSLAAVSAAAVRRVGEAGRRNRAAIAATSRVEWLASRQCLSIPPGTLQLESGVTETWATKPIAGGQELLDSVSIDGRNPEQLVLRTRVVC